MCTRTLRAKRSSWRPIGGIFAGIGVFAAAGALVSPYAAPVAAFLFAGFFVAAQRIWPPKVDRVFWYTGGLAQLIAGEAGPRVVRWDDATSVTASVETSGESDLTTVRRCTVEDRAGPEVTVDSGYGPSTPRDVLREAARVLSPRLLPPLIRAYDSGEPVIFGSTRIDLSGISIARARGKTAFTAWGEMRHIDGRIGGLVPELKIRTAARRAGSITLSGEPNGIFVFDLARHAAAQNGVPFRDVIPAAAPGLGAGWSAGKT